MQLQFLGTGAGMPSKLRNTTAIMLELANKQNSCWLFDCGEAAQHQILHTTIKPRKIEKIFITHLHGDHIFGLPGLLGSRSFLAGEEPLTIYGPKGIKQWIELTLQISTTHLKYPLSIIEIEEGVIFEDEQWTVEAKALQHVIPCFGYRVVQKDLPGQLKIEQAVALGVPKGPLLGLLKAGNDITLEDGTVVKSKDVISDKKKGKIITILGDTKYCDASIELAKNADVVIHEATFDAHTTDLAAAYGHSTNVEAALVAQRANAKSLILTHISARFLTKDLELLLQEAQAVFANTYLANDFSIFSVHQLAKNEM